MLQKYQIGKLGIYLFYSHISHSLIDIMIFVIFSNHFSKNTNILIVLLMNIVKYKFLSLNYTYLNKYKLSAINLQKFEQTSVFNFFIFFQFYHSKTFLILFIDLIKMVNHFRISLVFFDESFCSQDRIKSH